MEENWTKTLEAMENGFATFSHICCGEMLKIYCRWNGTEFKIFYETVFSFLYSCLHKLDTFLLNVDSGQDLLKFRFLNSCSNPQG